MLHLCVVTLCLTENVSQVPKVSKVFEFEVIARAYVIMSPEFFSKLCVWALELLMLSSTETQELPA